MAVFSVLLILLLWAGSTTGLRLSLSSLKSSGRGQFDVDPFGNAAGKVLGTNFEDEIGATLTNSGYQPFVHKSPFCVYNKKFEADIVCQGTQENWMKLTNVHPCSHIADAPVTEHIIIGECKLTADTLINWLIDEFESKAKEPTGIYAEFVKEKSLSIRKMCLFVNGGIKSQKFVSILNRDKSQDITELEWDSKYGEYNLESMWELRLKEKVDDRSRYDKFIAKELIILHSWNVFCHSYLSGEYFNEQQIRFNEQQIQMDEQDLRIQMLERLLKSKHNLE